MLHFLRLTSLVDFANVFVNIRQLTFSNDFKRAFLQAALLSASIERFSAGLRFSSNASAMAAEKEGNVYTRMNPPVVVI